MVINEAMGRTSMLWIKGAGTGTNPQNGHLPTDIVLQTHVEKR